MDEVTHKPDSEEPAASTAPADSAMPPAKRKHNKYFVRFALVAVVVFLAIPYWGTANPKNCTRCHNMTKYYESWQQSSHSVATKNCLECHVKPGTINLWVYRISFYRELYASMVGANLKPAGATTPGVDSCRRKGCHSLNRIESGSGDIKINHRLHVLDADVTCVRCHPGAAHPNVGKIGRLTPHRKLCFECHAARKNDCSFCHSKRFSANTLFKH